MKISWNSHNPHKKSKGQTGNTNNKPEESIVDNGHLEGTFGICTWVNSSNTKSFQKLLEATYTTMAQMAHFSFPYYFTILNSEF